MIIIKEESKDICNCESNFEEALSPSNSDLNAGFAKSETGSEALKDASEIETVYSFESDYKKGNNSNSETGSAFNAEEESRLVEAARNGDSLAITLLVVKYRRFLEKYVGLLNIPSGYKEDFIQEGLIGLLKSVRAYNNSFDCSFQTFAQRCVQNSVITELRKLNRRGAIKEVSMEELPEGMFDLISGSAVPSPEDEYIDEESSKQLRNTIFSVLSTYEAEVFEMYLAEIPYSVMSIRLGKDIKSIDNAIQRIKNKLKKLV